MGRGPRAFSTVSTGNSDIPSSCEMKEEPAFKPLQGNPTFYRVTASRYPLHLRQQTQGPSHVPIAEGNFLEVLVESWLTSSVKDRESALISIRYGVNGAFVELLY